jgi:hypothetical protein
MPEIKKSQNLKPGKCGDLKINTFIIIEPYFKRVECSVRIASTKAV